MGNLAGKVAVVTGAARGMGAKFAERLAQDGADVIAVDILDSGDTVKLIEATGKKGKAFKIDITSEEQVNELAKAVEAEFGPIHILVNNAGLHPKPMPVEELTYEFYKKYIAVNLDAIFLLTQAFLPQLKKNGWGRVINLSSASANAAPPNGLPYVTSKAGVIGITRAYATELGKYNITVNAIAPNPVRTPGADTAMTEELFQMVSQMQPIQRVMVPEDVSGVVSFLASDDSAFMTGSHLHVDGGMIRGD